MDSIRYEFHRPFILNRQSTNYEFDGQSFPEAFGKVKGNNFRGNYIAMVTKEKLRSLQFDYAIAQKWNQTDTQRQFPMVQLEIRRTAASPALFEFLKQDHVSFWNQENDPLPAVLLTDTSNHS